MNNSETTTLQYKDLSSFFVRKLWNDKSLTFTISRGKVDEPYIEIKIINNETNNTKSAK